MCKTGRGKKVNLRNTLKKLKKKKKLKGLREKSTVLLISYNSSTESLPVMNLFLLSLKISHM